MRNFVLALVAALIAALFAGAFAGPAQAAKRASAREYVVTYKSGVTAARAKAAVRASGGKVVATRKAMRIMLVRSSHRGFAKTLRAKRVIAGVARNRIIGTAKPGQRNKPDIELEGREAAGGGGGVTVREDAAEGDLSEPLAGLAVGHAA